jgi:hypothetical protein
VNALNSCSGIGERVVMQNEVSACTLQWQGLVYNSGPKRPTKKMITIFSCWLRHLRRWLKLPFHVTHFHWAAKSEPLSGPARSRPLIWFFLLEKNNYNNTSFTDGTSAGTCSWLGPKCQGRVLHALRDWLLAVGPPSLRPTGAWQEQKE